MRRMSLRDILSDDRNGRPPEIRDELLRLHGLAMAVFNEGSRDSVADLFSLHVSRAFLNLVATTRKRCSCLMEAQSAAARDTTASVS
jgi:hypothetical protein